MFDTNNDGAIDKNELMHVLQSTNKRGIGDPQLLQIVDAIMAKWDTRGQGMLEYPAFKDMLSSSSMHLSL